MSAVNGNVVEVTNICKTFKGDLFQKPFSALKDISFEIEKGESFGLIGVNGAGKSTTIKIILGVIFPDSGEVKILGDSPGALKVKKKISYLPENPVFYENLNGEDFIKFVGRLRGLEGKVLRDEVERWLFKVNLEKDGKKPLKKYSRGMIQRIGLAQAFIGNPELVILDEPLNGLDPLGRRMARDLIEETLRLGTTVFFTSHILEDIERICHRVAIIHSGRILRFVDVKDLKEGLEEVFIRTLEEYEESN
ncbi:MAG TPA: ABC transporter ATP-binding protein [Candidatus Hydrothermia bacterium]|nr:ABC transporter ATP-binding protein [Candidatus Hydrothermia bacterium]